MDLAMLSLRWVARIWSLASIGFILAFALGGGEPSPRGLTSQELALFFFFPTGVCLGMILAWRWEGLGGAVTVASLLGFYLLHRVVSGGYPTGFWFAVLAAPGLLFLLSWLWNTWHVSHQAVESS